MYKILIVEDEPLVRKGLILTIDWSSIKCLVVGDASNGERALELMKKTHPDIVITDIRMPKCDGLQLIEKSKELNLSARFIIISGYDDFEYAQTAIRLGVHDYILKPINEYELIETVQNLQKDIEKVHNQEKYDYPYLDNILELNEQLDNYNNPTNKFIEQINNFIEKHIHQSISIQDISESMNMSSGHLSRKFKNETSYTLLEYITSIRIRKAIELLQFSNDRINEIAYKVGYSDPKYFSSLFQKHIGITPTEYRLNHQNK